MRYNNYHKHTTYSSALVPDTHISMEAYFERALELGHTTYFTTEHGFAGSIFQAKKLGQKYGIKVIFSMEAYIVKDNSSEIKDRSNYHIMIIARTDKARRKINLINSTAHEHGYYYTARWSLDDILSFDKDDIYITSACVGGILKGDGADEIFVPIVDKFGDSVFIEIQSHNHDVQKEHNKKVLKLAEEYGLRLIHGNDSHYIYPEQGKDRLEYLKGKGITYDDEDSFLLDYPSYDEILLRYKLQDVVPMDSVISAIQNTLIFDDCEELKIDKSIKMPTLYPELSIGERYNLLEKKIYDKWEKIKPSKPSDKWEEYEEAIRFELDIIKDTNDVVHTSDYFLLNDRIIGNAQEKYGGKLTKTGRGSAPSFLLNYLLGFTSLDRLSVDVPMFPTRFMSTSRLIEAKKMPDIDYNINDPEPFVKATKDELGEYGCSWMIAYGTMKESEAFRNICRNDKLDFSEFNDVAKDLENIPKTKEWQERLERSKRQVGSIVSISRHPCANLLLSEDIREEIGLIRSGKDMVVTITSEEADDWKYLKNDYLTVTVVEILERVADKIGIKLPEVKEMLDLVENDDKVWEIYEKGLTATLDQTSTLNGRRLVMAYKPKNYKELSAWVAAIRPGFASLLDVFLNREYYTNGVDSLDKLLEKSQKFPLYQESSMAYLSWLGVPEDETYTIISNISKKKYLKDEYKHELVELKELLLNNWIEKVGTQNGFNESFQVIQDSIFYAFNASHSISVAINSIYAAYFKANYPLYYYSVVLDLYEKDIEMSSRLIEECNHFGIAVKQIKFRMSSSNYTPDFENNTIYKSISSVKGLNSKIGDDLYEMKDIQYNSFFGLLDDIESYCNINSGQMDTLIKLDFFSEFGHPKYLLKLIDVRNMFAKSKVIAKGKYPEYDSIISKYSTQTEKQFRNLDNDKIIAEVCESIDKSDRFTISELSQFQMEYLGYTSLQFDIDRKYHIIKSIDAKYTPKLEVQSLGNGETFTGKVNKKIWDKSLKVGDIIYIQRRTEEFAWKKTDDGFERDESRKEWHIKGYSKVEDYELEELIYGEV